MLISPTVLLAILLIITFVIILGIVVLILSANSQLPFSWPDPLKNIISIMDPQDILRYRHLEKEYRNEINLVERWEIAASRYTNNIAHFKIMYSDSVKTVEDLEPIYNEIYPNKPLDFSLVLWHEQGSSKWANRYNKSDGLKEQMRKITEKYTNKNK